MSPSAIVLSFQQVAVNSYGASTSVPTGNALTLTASPPILPADGGTYSSVILEFKNLTSGSPIIPQANTVVQLSSSSPQIGTVPQTLVFPAGSLFATASFKTTTTPGNTTITAFASGYQPASLSVSTRKVGGIPTALNVLLTPSVILPDPGLKSSVIVQAVDVFGNPVKVASDLTVSLSTSSSQVGSLPGSLAIPAGESFAETSFSPSLVAGQTTITASASGYTAGSSILTTVGPTPRRLVVSVAPALILASTGETATVSVQLQDNNSQTPAPAPSAVSVVLTSSNTGVANVPNPIITIPPGESYATVTITAGGSTGMANITASAQGYIKGSANVVAEDTAGLYAAPNSLAVYFAPSTLLPDNSTYPSAVVVALQYVDPSSGTAYPAISSGSVTVYARSSNNASMQVATTPGIIPAGQTHVSLPITTTFLPGEASITAQSVGLTPYTSSLLSFGLRPNALDLQFSPSTLLSDGRTYNSVFVGLIDLDTKTPARAPVNTVVDIASNSSVGGEVQSIVTILAGQTFARASFSTSGLPGVEMITATASNYTSANATLSLITPAATKLGLYAAPGTILANGQAYQSLVVQLQDSAGHPQKTDVPVVVQLATPSTVAGYVNSNVTIQAGSAFSTATIFSTNKTGQTDITAFANGFSAGEVQVNSVLLQLTGMLMPNPLLIPEGALRNMTVQASSGGAPIQNATVKWVVVQGGFMQSAGNRTDSNGASTALYKAGQVKGTYLLDAEITKPGYTTAYASVNANVTQVLHNSSFFAWTLLFIPVWLLIVVAGAGVSIFVIRRIRTHGSLFGRDDDAGNVGAELAS